MHPLRFAAMAAVLAIPPVARADISRRATPPTPVSPLAPVVPAAPSPAAPFGGAATPPGMRTVIAPAPAMPKFLNALAERFSGEPVIAVETGSPATSVGRGQDGAPAVAPAGQKLLEWLQDIGEEFSAPDRALIPFAVRGAWVLAPRERDEVVTTFSGLSTLHAMSRQALWREALTYLSSTQVSELSLPEGMAFASLPPAAQERVRRALRPPLRIETADPDGSRQERDVPPVDPAGIRLRARLRTVAPVLVFEVKNNDSSYRQPLYFSEPASPPLPRLISGDSGYMADLPSVRRVPNTFKPSDLDGARYPAPFGKRGVMTVSQALQQARTVTGLPLEASVQYRDRQVFVGSEALTTGEVLDAIRLAFTAAWRRLGDTYLLTWDRAGLGPLTELVRENGAGLVQAASEARRVADDNHVWLDFTLRGAFAEDDPFALTNAQRGALYAPRQPGQPWETPYILWPQLTQGQRTALAAALDGKNISVPVPGQPEWEQRTASPSDAANGALTGRIRIEFSVALPGIGWVSLPESWARDMEPDAAVYLRQRLERPPAPSHGVAPPRPPAFVQRRQATLLPARARAVITPVLAAEQVEPLAALMQARGFDTLFYPLLTDGRATITSKAFPPHPSVATGAGLVAVARVMRRHGVTVVGAMDTLAWRRPGEAGHWLEKYPGWLDADVLGRPFSEAVPGLAKAGGVAPPEAVGDLVRPSEPAVAAKLETLAREAAAVPELAGILFDAWTPSNAIAASPERSRALDWDAATGFAVPDRRAALQRDGVDPVDRPLSGFPRLGATDDLYTPPAVLVPPVRIENGRPVPPPPPPPGPDRLLLNRIAAVAPSTPRAWTTYAVGSPPPVRYGGYRPPGAVDRLPVNITLDPAPSFGVSPAGGSLLLRVPDLGAREAVPWGNDPSTPAISLAEGSLANTPNAPRLDLAVYDFRAAPASVLDSLRRVGLPPDSTP